PQFADTGNVPPIKGLMEVLNARDVSPNINWGPKVAVGYRWDNQAIEATGFYLPQNDSFALITAPRRLDLPFNNFQSSTRFPLGFSGNQGMWLQADLVRASLQTAVGSAEINYRSRSGFGYGFEWLVGVRYLDIDERFGIFTDDEGLTIVDVNGNPDPTRQALYTAR